MNTEIQDRLYLTMTEAGYLAGITGSRIHQLVMAGDLPSRRWGRRVFVERLAFEKWLTERRMLLGR